jgi:steroid delta-isomerase-like uncharacterized protein
MAAVCCLLTILSAVALAAFGAEYARATRTPVFDPRAWEPGANAATVTRFYQEVWNDGRFTDLTADIALDHILHDPMTMDIPAGPAGFAAFVAGLRQSFPDLTVTLDDVVAQGDRVIVRFTARGTHRGTFLKAEPTGQTVVWTGIAIHRFAYRQIAETWMTWDTFGAAQQVGLFFVRQSVLDWEGPPSQERPGQPS